jgi:oligopeptide transport system substrate-binding protein
MAPFLRRPFCCLLASLLALGLAGCGKRETKVASGDRAQILHLGNLSEPSDLDPATTDDDVTFNVVIALMEGLAQYDPQTCLPIPATASSWEVSADNLTWTFHLRPEARWSNGDPVTAHDFVYAYRRMLSPALAAEYAYMLFALKNGEAYYTGKISDFAQVGAHAPDDHTLVLQLRLPVPYLPRMVCHASWFPIHQATIEKFGRVDQRGTRWTRPGNYVGNGPFVLTEWNPHQIIRVTKAPTYWNRDQVRLNEIDFYPIEDNTTEEAMFRSRELHITSTMPIGKIAVYQHDPAISSLLHQKIYLATYYYCFNVKKPPLDDVRVRRALAYAINRRELVDRVSLGGQAPAGHLTPPGTAGFFATADVPFDAGKARQFLAEAGYPGGKGFPSLELLYNTSEGHRQIAEAIQQMWRRELGIGVTLRNEESKVQQDTLHQHNYQIARYAWVGDYVDPSTFLDVMLSDNLNNFTGWKNAEYDRVVSEADHAPDEQRRFELYQRAEQILADECPIAPLYFYTRNNLRRPDVKGWYDNLLDEHPYTGVYLEAPAH